MTEGQARNLVKGDLLINGPNGPTYEVTEVGQLGVFVRQDGLHGEAYYLFGDLGRFVPWMTERKVEC